MNLWRVIFTSDWLRVRPGFLVILCLHAVLLSIRLGYAGGLEMDPAVNEWRPPMLENMLLMGIFGGTMSLVLPLVLSDSPAVRGRFLATRPVPRGQVILAKSVLLFLMAVVPAVLGHVIYLTVMGMPAGLVAIAALQTALTVTLICAAALTFLHLWETPGRAVAGAFAVSGGLLLLSAGAFAAGAMGVSDAVLNDRLTLLASPRPWLLPGAGVTALLALLVRKNWRRPVSFIVRLAAVALSVSVLAGAALLIPSGFSRQAPEILPAPALTSIRYHGAVLTVRLPHPDSPPAGEVIWNRITLYGTPQGGERRRIGEANLRMAFPEGGSALSRYLGSDWLELKNQAFAAVNPEYALTTKPGDLPTDAMPMTLACEGRRCTMEVLGEMPVTAGASLQAGGAAWTSCGAAASPGERMAVSLIQRGPVLWLDPARSMVRPGETGYFLLDTERHLVCRMESRGVPIRRELAGATALPQRGLRLAIAADPLVVPDGAFTDPATLRLLIVRMSPGESVRMSWSSAGPVNLRATAVVPAQPAAPSAPPDTSPLSIAEWLGAHPAPESSSGDPEVVRWLVALLEQLQLPPTDDAAGRLVPGHAALFFQALDHLPPEQRLGRLFLTQLLAAHLPETAVPLVLERLPASPELVTILQRRGFLPAVHVDLVRLIRSGSADPMLMWAVLTLPGGTGMADEELLCLLRLYPLPWIWQMLRAVPGLTEELDRVADTVIDARLASLQTGRNDLLALALARGRSEGPAWLRSSLELLPYNRQYYFPGLIRASFTLPPALLKPDYNSPVEWFLARPVDSWRFDPDTRRYVSID